MTNEIKTVPQEERKSNLPVLTVDKDGNQSISEKEKMESVWHEIKNAFISKHILTGTLSGMEITPHDNKVIGVTYYNGFKISIPANELVRISDNSSSDTRAERIISSMIGAEISFIILAVDNDEKTVIASRLRANERNIQTFYFDKDSRSRYKIYEDSIVEARIIGVTSMAVRVEVFGAECNIQLRELFWDFNTDARDKFDIGDRVMVKITSLKGRDDENEPFSITASIRLAEANPQVELIKNITQNCIYIGKIIDIRKGTYLIKLTNGLSALAHSSHCRKPVMRGDTVAYVVKYINRSNYTVTGNITRIIKSGRI